MGKMGGTRKISIYFAEICTFLNLTLGIPFETVLGSLSRLKEMAPYSSMQMVRSNENNIIYSNGMNTNRNELIRRLLSGITNDELQNLVRVREEARSPIPTPIKTTPIPTPRKMGFKQLIRYLENNPIPLIPAPKIRTPMSMMRLNENKKIDYWDEIYPDDKIYIRPEDGKKFSIVDGIYYAVHPIYILFAASEDGVIIKSQSL